MAKPKGKKVTMVKDVVGKVSHSPHSVPGEVLRAMTRHSRDNVCRALLLVSGLPYATHDPEETLSEASLLGNKDTPSVA